MSEKKSKMANYGDRPARGRCSLCGCDLAGLEAIEEIRPTRSDGEAWQYCQPCWEWASQPVPDDRDMVTRYLVFLRGLVGIRPYCDWITNKLAGRDQPAETRPNDGRERSDDGKDTTETTDDAEGDGHCDPEAPGHERQDAEGDRAGADAQAYPAGEETVSSCAESEASGA